MTNLATFSYLIIPEPFGLGNCEYIGSAIIRVELERKDLEEDEEEEVEEE